jgi:hypothetical protein
MNTSLHCYDCAFYVVEERGPEGKAAFCSNPMSHMLDHALALYPPAPACRMLVQITSGALQAIELTSPQLGYVKD